MDEEASSLLPKRCIDILNKWRHCSSAYNQFHQYYIFGRFKSCNQIKTNFKNCVRWRTFRSEEAKANLLEALKKEKTEDMRADGVDDVKPVWEIRTEPPVDWNDPIENSD